MSVKTMAEVVSRILSECTESVSREFFPAVRPIYRSTKNGQPEHIATCTLLEIGQGKYLITAAHVVDENEHASLYVGGASELVEINGSFWTTQKPDNDRQKDAYDFAVCKIPLKMISELGDVQYIKETWLADDRTIAAGRSYLALGYPCSKNRKLDARAHSVKPTTWKYTSIVKKDHELAEVLGVSGNEHFFLTYDRKHSKDAEGRIVNPVDAHGLSGGPLIDMGHVAANLDPQKKREGRLAGLLIECRPIHKAIVSVKVGLVLRTVGVRA